MINDIYWQKYQDLIEQGASESFAQETATSLVRAWIETLTKPNDVARMQQDQCKGS